MQSPLFRRYQVDEKTFWAETNALVEQYHKRGYRLSPEIGYLNHLLTYVLSGRMAGLNNRILFECGREIKFYPGPAGILRVGEELGRPSGRNSASTTSSSSTMSSAPAWRK